MSNDPTSGNIPLGLDYNPPQPTNAGNAYLQQQRGWIAQELQQKPGLRRYIGGVIAHEQGPPGEQAKVFEAMANRMNYIHTLPGYQNLSVEDYLRGKGPGGQFYGPIQKGQINEKFLRDTYDANPAASNSAMDSVLQGSNNLRGYTDQGSRGDPNWHKGTYIDSNKESYGDWTGPRATTWRQQQQQQAAQAGPGTSAPAVNPAAGAAVAGDVSGITNILPVGGPEPYGGGGTQVANSGLPPGSFNPGPPANATPPSTQSVMQKVAAAASNVPTTPMLTPPVLGMNDIPQSQSLATQIPYYIRRTNPQLAQQHMPLPPGFTGYTGVG